MPSPHSKTLGLLTFFLVILGMLAFRIWMYKGTLQVDAPVPFELTLRLERHVKETRFSCPTVSCKYEITPGTYEMNVSAEGFSAVTREVEVGWRKVEVRKIPLRKIPRLVPLPERSQTWPVTEPETVFFFDADRKLFHEMEGSNTIVADFSENEGADWQIFPENENRLFVLNAQELYEVDVRGKRKFRIFSAADGESLKNLRVFSGNVLLLQAESGETRKLFFFFPESRTTKPFPQLTDSALICQNPEQLNEFLYLVREENSWITKKTNLKSEETTGVSGYNFKTAPREVFCETENSLVIETEEEVFRLEF